MYIERHNAWKLKLPNWQWELAYRVVDSEGNTLGYFTDTSDARRYIHSRDERINPREIEVRDCQ